MGYFASGWPKAYAAPRGTSRVVTLRRDPTERFLLVVSCHALHIWSAAQHRVLLGRFILADSVVDEEGEFVAAAWSPDGLSLIASLSKGLTLVFSIAESPLPDGRAGVTDFCAAELARPAHPPRPLHPLVLRRVAEARVAHAGSVVTACCAVLVGALIATSAGGLSCLSWDGDILWRVHVPELLRKDNALRKMGVAAAVKPTPGEDDAVIAVLSADGDDDAGGILALTYEPVLGFVGVVLGSGPSLLLSAPDGGLSQPSAVDGRWLRASKSASIALEPRRMLATVGLADGDVEQYYVGVPPGDTCPVIRKLSLSGWYFEPDDVGAAMHLAWTPDGAALVVGWERRGLAVWSVSGCRLMWTLPQVGGTLPTTPGMRGRMSQQSSLVHPMKHGVAALEWGPQGLFLWASPSPPISEADALKDPHFVEFTFYKSVVAGVAAQGDSGRLSLLGTDRVLLLAHVEGNQGNKTTNSAPSPQLFSWQHLIIPHDYLGNNWPPSKIAVNDDASLVAVAGAHGVAICTAKSQRWKVFGDLRHDRRIKCCALGWVGRTIVVGNEVDDRSSRKPGVSPMYELLLYSRDALDSTALQAQYKLKNKPLLMDVRSDGYLLVLCEESLVYLFKIKDRHGTAMELKLVYDIFLPAREKRPETKHPRRNSSLNDGMLLMQPPQCRIDPSTYLRALPAPGGGISEVRIFPSLDQAMHGLPEGSKIPVPKQIMLLRSTGSLILLNTENMVSTPLLRYVERFWYTPPGCRPFDDVLHRPVWWAYGDNGLHVCFRDGMHRFLELRDMSRNGIFMGSDEEEDLQQRLSRSARRRRRDASTSISRRSGVSVEQWFELDPEVYPLAIMSVSGMVLGATQGLISHSGGTEDGEMPCQVIQVKRQPILHTLLRHLLLKPKSDDRAALQVALKCVSQPQFADSLEWLLYEAVLEHDERSGTSKPLFRGNLEYSSMDEDAEDANGSTTSGATEADNNYSIYPESPRRKSGGGDLCPRVIRLLRYFGEYEDIVVRCARKLDSKRWPLLFSLAGEPAALLEQCFMSGRLRTAACLLVILQEMWGFISSTPHSLRLVQAALDRGELSLAADLANFLGKADRAGMLNSSQLRTVEDVSWIAEAVIVPRGSTLQVYSKARRADEPTSRIPAVDLAVLKHAHVLLSRMDFRNLAALAVRMEFPLAEWLRRELVGKHASCPFVRDFHSTILSLHRQFQFKEPSLVAVRKARAIFETKSRHSKSVENDVSVNHIGVGANGTFEEKTPMVTPRTFADTANKELTGFASDIVFGSQLPPPPSSYDTDEMLHIREKAMHLCKQELKYLLTVAQTANAPDLLLCFATLLIDIEVIREVMEAHVDVRRPYLAALNEFGVSGYEALIEAVTDIANDGSISAEDNVGGGRG